MLQYIPEYYEFQNSAKLLSGERALEHIPYELSVRGCKRPMLLSDRVLEKFGAVATVTDAMYQGEVTPAACFLDIPADSAGEVVNEAARQFRAAGCASIIAGGGGSVLDKKQQMEFISHFLLPDVAVLDPRMTATLPPKTTASTGMDALCHAIEGYTCLQRNPASDGYAVSAIEIIRENLDTAVTNGKDLKARLAMANAAYLAGAAFSNSMVGLVHAIGHALGGVCHVPHGDAMTILLPHCMEFNMDTIGHLYGRLYLHLGGYENFVKAKVEDYGRLSVQTVRDMTARYHEFCNLPITLSQAGVKKEDFEAVARTALNDGAMIVNPKQVTFDDVIAILNAAY